MFCGLATCPVATIHHKREVLKAGLAATKPNMDTPSWWGWGWCGGGVSIFEQSVLNHGFLWTCFTRFVQRNSFLRCLSGVCSIYLPSLRDHGKIPKRFKTRRSWSNLPIVFLSIQDNFLPIFLICLLLWHRCGADETSRIRLRLDSFWCGSSLICQSKPSFEVVYNDDMDWLDVRTASAEMFA